MFKSTGSLNKTKYLKNAFMTKSVLALPIDSAPIRAEVDSSDFAKGGVLSQYINGKWHLRAYRSKLLSETVHKYNIYDKEIVTIIAALEVQQQYLPGASEKI